MLCQVYFCANAGLNDAFGGVVSEVVVRLEGVKVIGS